MLYVMSNEGENAETHLLNVLIGHKVVLEYDSKQYGRSQNEFI